MPPEMIRVALTLFVLPLLPALLACGDDCVQLADRICECEPTLRQRQACRLDYQTQQENQPPPSESQLLACRAAVDTCTCDALDRNQTEQCGFARGEVP